MAGGSRAGTIFISIAAYRDPDLVPTVADCLAKASNPRRLRFGICWQYGPEHAGASQLTGPQFAVHYVDWRLSRGACWARADIMRLYDGEDWYLQLDSHHRFSPGWDAALIGQAALTGSEKPVLSTYAAPFTPGAEADAAELVTTMEADRFTEEGVLLPKPGVAALPLDAPLPARFVSAHFLFAPGSFAREVPYDPELYFLGEEITLAVRAFTHGFDLFHPARHILWHEYTRANRAKHWDDHLHEGGVKVAWHERDQVSLAKAGRLLTEPWIGTDGMGSVRTVGDYEAYAGVSFRHRRVQDYTRLNKPPPNPQMSPRWAERARDRRIELHIERSQLPTAALDDPRFWYVGVHDGTGQEIYRQDADTAELSRAQADQDSAITLVREFTSEQVPASWTVMAYSASRGWLDRVSGPVPAGPQIFVSIASYRDPDLIASVSDCLAKARHPGRLRFVICWQHGPDEALPEWMHEPQFRVLDVNWQDSRGACWARAAIMEHWAGEDWFLQIDSHQRFAQDWDDILISQATRTGSLMPLLSAPAPPFTIGQIPADSGPLGSAFAGFRDNGIPEIKTGFLQPEVSRRGPVRSRAICGHLLFAPGRFARDVPYDPEMYFSWEETTMAVRAFTHGYDLFHPTVVVTWHEYTRAYRDKHWDDHTGPAGTGVAWHDLYEQGIARTAQFFADPVAGPLGLGRQRTFSEYEAYAGVDFRRRRVQDYTRLNLEPPNPPAERGWAERVRDRRVEITVDVRRLPEAATKDPVLWYVGCHDRGGREMYRQDADRGELSSLLIQGRERITLVRQFSSETVPASWTVLPLSASAGWLEPITGPIPASSSSRPPPATRLRVLTSDNSRRYQQVTYQALASRVDFPALPPSLIGDSQGLAGAISRANIFHLHWPEVFLGPDSDRHEAIIAALERARVPVVWTQHNLEPHDSSLDMGAIYQRWADTACGVIHHSRWGEQRVRERYRFREDAVHRVIPHPHFGPLLQSDGLARPEIEAALGLRHDVLRLAVVGAPRPARDVALAMRAVAACHRTDVELLAYALGPRDSAPADERVVAAPYQVVPRLLYDSRLRVTDALIMPFEPGHMLTTGTVGDAIAHGLPCLISDWPYLSETLGEASIYYGRTANDLAATIDALTWDALAAARTKISSLRDRTDPQRVGDMTLALLAELAA